MIFKGNLQILMFLKYFKEIKIPKFDINGLSELLKLDLQKVNETMIG